MVTLTTVRSLINAPLIFNIGNPMPGKDGLYIEISGGVSWGCFTGTNGFHEVVNSLRPSDAHIRQ